MGTYITITILFALFIAAAFIAARLDDKLQKERNLTKNLLNDITQLKAKIKILENRNTANDSYCKENCKGYQETGKCYADYDCEAKRKADVVKPIFKVGDEVYNKFDKSLAHVIIEYVDEATYYGDTTNFDIIDQDQWGIVRSCENCKCGHYNYPTVSCYLHRDCGGDEPIIIHDDDFVETAMNCKEFEQEN